MTNKQNYFTYTDNTSDNNDKIMENLHKQIIIDDVDVSGCCQYMPRYMEDYDIDTLDYCRHHFKPCKDVDVKYCYYKQLKREEQECEELKNTITNLENIRDKFSAKLDQLKAKNEELIRRITKIFACLIKANRTNKIVDTLWVDNITTLWDYIAQTLGIEGDQVQIEEQILQKISECEANQ